MLTARQVVLDQDLHHHREDHQRPGEPGAPLVADVHREPDDSRRRAGVHHLRVRGGQPQERPRPEGDADPRVQRPGQRRPVRHRECAPPPQAHLRQPEHQQDLGQRTPHRQIERGHEQRQRGTQEGERERVLGPYGSEAPHRPVAPRLVLRHLDRGRQRHRAQRQRERPHPVSGEPLSYGREQRSPLPYRRPAHRRGKAHPLFTNSMERAPGRSVGRSDPP
ncbi:hypothetical protein SGL43_01278 [Streptomyces globisporus]|uniref:Uncharacterized protein n=1 Tax=Streptomyces globisporus TaxID=1908 RepID=A0ABN8UXK7_STRGL|nr:hypothetical protein SGL43_01278 [Streptomyces globisporus]